MYVREGGRDISIAIFSSLSRPDFISDQILVQAESKSTGEIPIISAVPIRHKQNKGSTSGYRARDALDHEVNAL